MGIQFIKCLFLKIREFLLVSLLIIIAAYGMYEFAGLVKRGSYYFFYEDMVIKTIKEEVKKDSWNNQK